MKKGDIITIINGVTFYYFGIDPIMKHDGKSCHFLTTDINNKYCHFRVSPNKKNWKTACKRISKLYT